jgi:hypothetical protein
MTGLALKELKSRGFSMTGRIVRGRVDSSFFSDGMTITFDEPQFSIGRHDALRVRTPESGLLDISVASIGPAAVVLVWYAPDPLLRHWLGRLERRDDLHWVLRMEPYHVDILKGIPIAPVHS